MTSAFLSFFLVAAGAQTPALLEGQKRYDADDYQAAARLFSDAAQAAPSDASAQYNLGNALLKSGRLGPAIVAYERAFRLWPRDADVRDNLDFALKRAGEQLVPPGTPPALFIAFHWLGERELAGLQWLGCWAFLLMAAAYARRERWRAALRPWTAGALLFWGLAAAWWGARLAIEPSPMAVIVMPSIEIRSGPGENFPVSFTVPEGRRVEVLSEGGRWLEIGVLKEGARGWLQADAVEKI